MLRNGVGIGIGVLMGAAANLALGGVGMVVWPPPAGLDVADPAALAAYVGGLPTGALLVVLLAHNTQAFLGGWVAARIGTSVPIALALVIGVLTALGSAYNLATLPGPPWMWVDVPLNLAAAYAAGARVASARR